jgi:hypothetical protein
VGDKVNLLRRRNYSINKVNFIRQSLAGYGGGSAIASEMVQNADDANADCLSFYFRNDSLVVRNSSVFSEQDFESITDIAKGEKSPEKGKIGTWGTGFLSVFHITDAPELLSSGEHITFDPTADEVFVFETDIKDYTEFRLPWRRQETELSRRLEADIWQEENISILKEKLTVDVYQLVLFLRHVRIIEVYEGETDEKLIARVELRRIKEQKQSDFTCEQWQIEYKRAGVQSRTDTWLYYRQHIPRNKRPLGVTIKDTEIALAFPVENRDWLTQNVPGSLYNFLPTPIQTGLPFQINGAFFPDNNRRSILLDPNTQREKSAWNRQVLAQLGYLFTNVVLDIRDRVGEPRRFYELLPVSPPRRNFLESIRQPFIQTASELPIVKTSMGSWERPRDVFIGRRGSRLPELAANYLPILPTGVPQEFRDFLEKEIRIPTLKIGDVLDYLKPSLKAGIPLNLAHPMINSREKLEILYSEISRQVSENIRELPDFAICLAEDQTLWPFNEIWWADKSTRRLLAGTDVRFMDIRTQEKPHAWRGKLVDEFKGAELVKWLGKQAWPETEALSTGFVGQLKQIGNRLSKWFQPAPSERRQNVAPLTMGEPPSFIRDAKHLSDILTFIAQDLHQVDATILSRLPLVRSEADYLLYPNQLYRYDDLNERDVLKKLNLQFVYADWSKDEKIWSVYEKAGVKYLEPADVINALEETTAGWTEDPDDELIEYLGFLYQYFERCHLDEKDKNRLRRLPLCVTQNGHLIPAQGGKVVPHLPSDQNSQIDRKIRQHLDKLQLDNLIHSKLIARGKRFLTNILQVETLSPTRLIETVIIPYYLDTRLDDVARQDLLNYCNTQLQYMSEVQRRALFPKLLDKQLIRCADGEYRPAQSVYFASPALDTVFANGYHKLHPDYGVQVAQPDAPSQTPYRDSTWYWLFHLLGINEHPTPADLIRAVRMVVSAGPPTEARVEAVRRVYELLNREIGKGQPEIDSELKKLADLAWLPAQNDTAQWHYPRNLYQASHTDFVGNQAPLLRLGESSAHLRHLLGMPNFPPVEIVAKHLLASAGQKIEVKRRVYDDLGRRWKKLSSELQSRLKNEAVVWGGETFWPARHVFLMDYNQQFGRRRCYLNPPGGDAQKFLEQLGVRSTPHPWEDSLALLEEIAKDYNEHQVVSDDDRSLLFSNFDHLGHQLQREGEENPADLEHLCHLAIVPDSDGILRLPNRVVIADQPEILDQFDQDALPVVSDERLSESAYRFLLALGVPKLSQIVHRIPVDTTGSKEDNKISLHLQQLIPAFQRIALTLQEKQNYVTQTDLPKERLKKIRLRVCKKLMVEYVLDDGQGWRIQGHRRSEEALYSAGELNILYLKQKNPNKLPFIPLARELERILFPDSKESVVIDQLLQKPLTEVDGYLDEHGYRRLYSDESLVKPTESSQDSLVGWTDAEEGPAPWEEEAVTGKTAPAPWRGDLFGALEGEAEEETSDVSTSGVTVGASGAEKHPAFESEPSIKTSTVVSSSEVEFGTAEAETIPPFTGMRRPAVPVLPNNYGELRQRFGLKRQASEVGEADAVTLDTSWEDPRDWQTGDGAGQVRQVRFTLTFTNRYEGFLPLHHRVRQMLADQPTRLTCQTDFEEWTFNLYVDYREGLIYNQEKLPRFFEAYNVPAGGIVYLETIRSGVVRLFWKPVGSRVEKVRCLELLDDGTLDEYEVPSAEFPCEISEYVLRAEKRLEDQEALFKQALDKRGVFQTICEVFGKPGRELIYDEIYQGVMAQRMVAKASIDYQLNQRPCFVKVDDDRWRFEPERGSEPTHATQHRASDEPLEQAEKLYPEVVTSKKLEARPPQIYDTPYHRLLEDIRQEWERLGNLLQLNGNEPLQQLEQLGQGLLALGQRLQADLSALAQSQPVEDDLLTMLWRQLLEAPQKQETQQNLQRYLAEQIQQTENFIEQIDYQLASTPFEQRRDFIFPMLSRLAREMAEQGHIPLARQLYNMLQKQGAGDFERELEQLAQSDAVNEYIQLVEVAETEDERWQMWRDAWQKYPGFPTLRQAIQKDIKSSVNRARQTIKANLEQDKSEDAYNVYLKLLEQINPFVDVWQTDQNIPPLVGELAQRLFEVFQGHEKYRESLQIVASLPSKTGWNLSGDIYLEAIKGVADEFENRTDNLAAAALIDYGIYLVEKKHWPVGDYVLSDAYEHAGRLYQNLAMPHRAYAFIKQAHSKATGERKTKLGHRAYAFNQQRVKTKEQAEAQSRQAKIEVLLNRADFAQLVNSEMFRLFCEQK